MCASEGWGTYGQWAMPEFKFKKEMGIEMSLIRDHAGELRYARC